MSVSASGRKTVLISGADGYIALHMTRILRERGYEVRTATRNGSESAEGSEGEAGALRMDFSAPYEIAAMRIGGIDAMIHTVSPNEGLYKTDPYRAVAENAAGIRAALDFCVQNGIADFLYLSSFHVFGAKDGRLTEDTPAAPRNDYGLAHYVAEQTVQLYDRTKRVNGWVLRASNLFGVPADCGKFKRWYLIPFLFCREAVERGTITLLTPGRQLRNFVGVSDVCKKALWLLETRPEERLLHAYGRETISVIQYARLVQKVAEERFRLPVRIISPEGYDNGPVFAFASRFNVPELAPAEDLESFAAEMLTILLAGKQKG